MLNLIKKEIYYFIHNRIYWYAAAGICLLGFLSAETYVPEVMGPSGRAAATLADILDGMVYDSTFLLIIISCILALILGQEFSYRTISHEVCTGHKRLDIFFSKIYVCLTAFNLMAILYPVCGCIREFTQFGLPDPVTFLYHFVKAVIYSFLLNSAVFLFQFYAAFYFETHQRQSQHLV